MSDNEPGMKLDLPNGEFEARRENTSLFTFLSRACYNHIFLQMGEQEDNTITGTYVFCQHPAYEQMVEYMIANDYPQHLNLADVAECDSDAWDRMIAQEAEGSDHIPDEWLDGEA